MGRSYRARMAGQDVALTHAVLLFGIVGLAHGITLLAYPSAFAAEVWQTKVFTFAPRPMWGAVVLTLGVAILVCSAAPVDSTILAFLLLAKALTMTILALCFASYAVGHHGQALWAMEMGVGWALVQLIVAMRALRLR